MPRRGRVQAIFVDDDLYDDGMPQEPPRPPRTQRVLYGVRDPTDEAEIERAMRCCDVFCYRGFRSARFEDAATSLRPELADVFRARVNGPTAMQLLRADICWARNVLHPARRWANDGEYRALAAAVIRAAAALIRVIRAASLADEQRYDELRRQQLAECSADLPVWIRRRELGSRGKLCVTRPRLSCRVLSPHSPPLCHSLRTLRADCFACSPLFALPASPSGLPTHSLRRDACRQQ
jgi:hypothetical protein